ncbi:MAG: hypothetical protein ACRDSP_25820 [Pseudonocardiaceae bacterium]
MSPIVMPLLLVAVSVVSAWAGWVLYRRIRPRRLRSENLGGLT